MEIAEDLRVLAQLAMTLIGFTGIVGVLQTRGGSVLSEIEKALIVGLLLMSTATVFLAFVPSWLAQIPSISPNLWHNSFVVLLVGHLIAWSVAIPFLARGKILFVEFPLIDRIALAAMILVGVGFVVLEVAVISGHLLLYAPFIFEGVLIFFLAIGIYSFIRLLLDPA